MVYYPAYTWVQRGEACVSLWMSGVNHPRLSVFSYLAVRGCKSMASGIAGKRVSLQTWISNCLWKMTGPALGKRQFALCFPLACSSWFKVFQSTQTNKHWIIARSLFVCSPLPPKPEAPASSALTFATSLNLLFIICFPYIFALLSCIFDSHFIWFLSFFTKF